MYVDDRALTTLYLLIAYPPFAQRQQLVAAAPKLGGVEAMADSRNVRSRQRRTLYV